MFRTVLAEKHNRRNDRRPLSVIRADGWTSDEGGGGRSALFVTPSVSPAAIRPQGDPPSSHGGLIRPAGRLPSGVLIRSPVSLNFVSIVPQSPPKSRRRSDRFFTMVPIRRQKSGLGSRSVPELGYGFREVGPLTGNEGG